MHMHPIPPPPPMIPGPAPFQEYVIPGGRPPFPGLPFMHPGHHGDPRPIPGAMYNPHEVALAPAEPDAGRLFGRGASGPPAHTSNSPKSGRTDEYGPNKAKGPYTSEATPYGPTPAPLFLDPEESENVYSKALVRAPGVEGYGRGVAPKPYRPHDPHPAQMRPPHMPRAKPSLQEEPAFIRRNAEVARRGSMPSLVQVEVDEFKEPWQKERQVWQRPEHSLSMFGLAPLFTPARYKGRPVHYRQRMQTGNLKWNVLKPPATATYHDDRGQISLLTEEGMNSLIVDSPESVMHLVYRPVIGEEVLITIHGSEAGITCGNVMSKIYQTLQKPYLPKQKEDRMLDRSYFPELVRIDKPLPMYYWLGDKTMFGGIVSDDGALFDMIGNDYWGMRNTWLLILKSD